MICIVDLLTGDETKRSVEELTTTLKDAILWFRRGEDVLHYDSSLFYCKKEVFRHESYIFVPTGQSYMMSL